MAKRIHKKKKHQLPSRLGDGATPERKKQLGGIATEVVNRDASGKAYVLCHKAKIECALDYYWNTRKINAPQRQAGMKVRGIYMSVGNGPAQKLLSDLVMVDNGNVKVEDRMLQHVRNMQELDAVRERLTEAQEQMLYKVCCLDQYAGHSEKTKTLRRALDQAAMQFGLIPDTKKIKTVKKQ